MLRMLWAIAGTVLAGIALFNWLTHPLEVDQMEQETFVAKAEELHKATLKKVSEKLHEKYVGVDVKTTPKKELVLQVVGNEKYFNSIKKDLESMTKSVIQNSPLQDHTVVFERWELTFAPKENEKIHNDLHLLGSALTEGLEDYGVTINIDYQQSITVHTVIEGSNKKAHQLAMEIEEAADEILFNLAPIGFYEINILNTKGKKIN